MSETLRLRGISGDVEGKVWDSEPLLRVGRLGTLEIVLDHISVSRLHAEIRQEDGKWWIRDLDSADGTFVNGVRRRSGARRLYPSDIIQFGNVAMTVEIGEFTQPRRSEFGKGHYETLRIGSKPRWSLIPFPPLYIWCLRLKLGNEVGSARLHVEPWGVYCTYSDPVGEEYAQACLDHGPRHWWDIWRSRLAEHLECCEIVAGWYP